MTEFRCEKCGKLLAKIDLRDGVVEIKCPRCKETNTKQENHKEGAK